MPVFVMAFTDNAHKGLDYRLFPDKCKGGRVGPPMEIVDNDPISFYFSSSTTS